MYMQLKTNKLTRNTAHYMLSLRSNGLVDRGFCGRNLQRTGTKIKAADSHSEVVGRVRIFFGGVYLARSWPCESLFAFCLPPSLLTQLLKVVFIKFISITNHLKAFISGGAKPTHPFPDPLISLTKHRCSSAIAAL